MKILFALMFLVSSAIGFGQPLSEKWFTVYETSGYKKTPRYAETMEYCRRLEKASPWIKVTSFGKSPQGRDLPLVIVSTDKAFTPAAAAKTGKAIVLIQNGIHAGEIDGKDACLMMLRDIAVTKSKASLLDHVILLIIPIYNVDGHERFGPYNRINQKGPDEMGWRVTAQNLNLNRDYIKADAPETQAWLRMFNAWLPDFFIDTHVTDGADYQYVVTFGIENGDNVAGPVKDWINNSFLPVISQLHTNDNVPVGPLIFLKDDLDPRKGLQPSVGTAPPRFSTVYTTLQNRPGMLIEMHMIKDYETRVTGITEMLDATIQRIDADYQALRRAVRQADDEVIQGKYQSLGLEYAADTVATGTMHYYCYRQSNMRSSISGGVWRRYKEMPFELDIPVFEHITPTTLINTAIAYLIPPEWTDVLDRLRWHGLKLERLKSPAALKVERYKFNDVRWQPTPFEGRLQLQYHIDRNIEVDSFPRGTIVVRMNQRAGKVAVHCLEPEGPDALVRWGFFNSIFEQKEYAEDYVLEQYAVDRLRDDSDLSVEFSAKLRTDSTFAKDPAARLRFFYERSPYWDKNINLYPVARLMVQSPLKTEPVR